MIRLPVSLAAMAAVLLATPVAAQDGGPRVFTRTGQWALDMGTESCRIARAFTNGEDQVSLALERSWASDSARLIVVGNSLRPFRAAEEIGYSYLPANDQRTARYIRSETADGQGYFNFGSVVFGPNPVQMINREGVPPVAGAERLTQFDTRGGGDAWLLPPYNRATEQAFAAGITAIELNDGLMEPIRLETGSLRGAITALQACADDLLRSWGLDWERHQTMTRDAIPTGPAFDWVPTGIVGFRDFAAFAGGQNPFRVMVSAEGRPTSCTAIWVSLDASQNERICAGIMENGTFTPALNAAGTPMASYWIANYMFALSRPFPGR